MVATFKTFNLFVILSLYNCRFDLGVRFTKRLTIYLVFYFNHYFFNLNKCLCKWWRSVSTPRLLKILEECCMVARLGGK